MRGPIGLRAWGFAFMQSGIQWHTSSSVAGGPWRFARCMNEAQPETVGGVMETCAKLVDSGIIKTTATTKLNGLEETFTIQGSNSGLRVLLELASPHYSSKRLWPLSLLVLGCLYKDPR